MATAPTEKTADKGTTTQVQTGNDTPMGVDGKESKDTVVEKPKAEAPKPEAKDEKKGPQKIRAVYGRMVDPHTALEFTQAPRELFKKTSWVQAQLDAGKLELVED
jgi:hypothetical protein